MNGIMKAVQRLAGMAATAVQDESHEQLKSIQQAALNNAQQQQLYSHWVQSTTANTSTNAGMTWINPLSNRLGGGMTPTVTTSGFTYASSMTPVITFTDDQMTAFMSKLADLLTRGWECLRCHRIWSPQVTGCEFCNFIDRLEGKDVDRDTAAG